VETDGRVEVVLADGSGALRFKDAQSLVDFTADAYLAGGAADGGSGETPPREPVK
jgi:hypothetical protein